MTVLHVRRSQGLVDLRRGVEITGAAQAVAAQVQRARSQAVKQNSSRGVLLNFNYPAPGQYQFTSLDPDRVSAADLLRYVRGHWQIENSLHFLKDRWWDEDRHHTRRPGLSAVLAAINNIALSVHRLRSDPNQPLRASADFLTWSSRQALELLQT